MFSDIEIGKKANQLMQEAVINYDTSDLSRMITESDNGTFFTIEAYRSLMTKTLTESAGQVTPDVGLIMEEANEHIGQRLLTILKAVKDWIMKKLNEIVLAIQNFITTNKKVAETVVPKLKERLGKGEFKDGPTAELYTYNLGVIDINRFVGQFDKIFKSAHYDLSGEYALSTAENLDKNVKLARATSREDIYDTVIKEVYKGAQAGKANMNTVKMLAHEDIRGGKGRSTVKFDEQYVKILEANTANEGDTKKNVTELFKKMAGEVDKMINEIKTKIKDVKKDSKVDEKKFVAGQIAFYNEKIRILNIALDALAMLNSIKLQAVIERANEARKFCVKAYHYKVKGAEEGKKEEKPIKESAMDYPYAFSLVECDLEIDDDDELPGGDPVTEGSW